jgi:hypothetical protein
MADPRDTQAPDQGASLEPGPNTLTTRDTELDIRTNSHEPASTERVRDLGAPSPHDTLLSAPAPADRAEIEIEDRLRGCERRIEWLENRVKDLEKRRSDARAPWVLWLVFFVVLAVTWQLVGRPLLRP